MSACRYSHNSMSTEYELLGVIRLSARAAAGAEHKTRLGPHCCTRLAAEVWRETAVAAARPATPSCRGGRGTGAGTPVTGHKERETTIILDWCTDYPSFYYVKVVVHHPKLVGFKVWNSFVTGLSSDHRQFWWNANFCKDLFLQYLPRVPK